MPGGVQVCEEVGQLLIGLEEVRAGQFIDRDNWANTLAAGEFGDRDMLGRAPLGQSASVT